MEFIMSSWSIGYLNPRICGCLDQEMQIQFTMGQASLLKLPWLGLRPIVNVIWEESIDFGMEVQVGIAGCKARHSTGKSSAHLSHSSLSA